MRNREEQFDEGLQGIFQGIISIETEDPKVDITPTEGSLQHGEADGDTLELQSIDLILWHLSQCQDAIACKNIQELCIQPWSQYFFFFFLKWGLTTQFWLASNSQRSACPCECQVLKLKTFDAIPGSHSFKVILTLLFQKHIQHTLQQVFGDIWQSNTYE